MRIFVIVRNMVFCVKVIVHARLIVLSNFLDVNVAKIDVQLINAYV